MADAGRAFLSELIDDAGLFPPASLSMADAAAQHRGSRDGPYGWMLGRFVCPASRLAELGSLVPDGDQGWRLSVILEQARDGDPLVGAAAGVRSARRFEEGADGRASVELVEARLPDGADEKLVRRLVDLVDGELPGAGVFLEYPAASPGLPGVLGAMAGTRAGAKIRCGGAAAEQFPSPGHVALFVDACRRLGIPFKATAGLHHPFRHTDRGTGHHGFVNLGAAAVLGRAHDLDTAAIEEIVADSDPASFRLSAVGLGWRDLEADAAAVAEARSELFVAYGSCSFAEPVDDLVALGAL